MLDLSLIASKPEVVKDSLLRRHASKETLTQLDTLVTMISRRRQLQTETDLLRADRKRLSKQIGQLMKTGRADEATDIKSQVQQAAIKLETLENERKQLVEDEHQLALTLPNLLDPATPDGKDEDANVVQKEWGEPRAFDFEPRDHHDLGTDLGIIDFARAAKLAGARFSVLKDGAARMERALINFFIDKAVAAGYTEMMVPYIVSRSTMTGTGQLPKFENDAFRVSHDVGGEDAFLISTAEIPLTNLHRDEILSEDQLPMRSVAFTPCFRAEAGSYGRDTRGLIRQHQFHKVELVHITTPEQSAAEHERLTRHAESLLEALNLPYRRMALCGGDIGFGARVCYDLEVWLPGQAKYREISSCSNCGDFQARRMKLRYRPEGGGKPIMCHTLNGSGLAVGRTLVAIMENYQNSDGSISVPQVLQPYMGLDRIQ